MHAPLADQLLHMGLEDFIGNKTMPQLIQLVRM
jgi:hypothetical protein